MNVEKRLFPSRTIRGAVLGFLAIIGAGSLFAYAPASYLVGHAARQKHIPNNHPAPNPGGKAATFSTQGAVNLSGEYFQPQGTNGRSCASCHIPEDAWSINPGTLQDLFDHTNGTHPIFNTLDANNPNMDVSTPQARLAAYSMLLSRGVFRRGGAPRPNSEWELIAVDDPHGFASLDRLVHWRRVMPTINFAVGSATVNWDGGNSIGTDQLAGLVNQANRNVTGAQQGPPASAKQLAYIQALMRKAGYDDFRSARTEYRLTPRQARGKFTKTEASAMIDRLTSTDEDNPTVSVSEPPTRGPSTLEAA